MKGIMLDMYRQPEELKAMLDLMVESSIASVVDLAQMFKENNIIFIPLHRGAEGFMSFDQFEEFYWPTLTKIMEGLIEKDLIPMPFFEGRYTDRFPYLTEFAKKHKGKLVYWFDQSDIIKGKEEFGDYATIKGNVPASLLVTGTPQQVEKYVKQSLEGCMEGGGYIVDGGVSGIPDESKPENVKAMTDAVFKYGIYRK
jgi:uroporphyrinogen-III decarboxylase